MIEKLKRIIKTIISCIWRYFVFKRVASCGNNLHVNRYSKVSSSTYLGNNVNFNGMTIYGCGKVVIGDNFHSGRDCLMISENHNYNQGDAIPYDSTYIPKNIIIKDNVWLGDRVIVLGGVEIGEGSIIQAGSVVVNDIPSCSIAGGHPARVFSKRDEKHYYLLKEKKAFH